MHDVTISNQAREDLIAIWEYVADNNPSAADRLLDMLDARIDRLADHPFLGPARPDIARDFRYLVCDNYLILYRALADAVEIVRVLHGARNLTAIFTDIAPPALTKPSESLAGEDSDAPFAPPD
ncbi:type II toxin-antitoxin system RelE/ParE family toxin [Thiocapsa sp.]|uniref:type II toxin-antitoxin system RelE/ParE family toxin n=1 Tax=Thiocapsa sp. TaxID=2024551 RepID=UPI001BD0B533|nr:type II toxin-antitoxin system RelE/ParE family toxin [Thiocapsa sp.]